MSVKINLMTLQLEMAQTLGISKQNVSNKVKRNTFSPDELVKIADMLEMEIAFIDKSATVADGNKYPLDLKLAEK